MGRAWPNQPRVLVYLDPRSTQGKRIADLSQHVRDEYLTAEQSAAFAEVQVALESGRLEIVHQVLWAGEGRSLAAEEFPALWSRRGSRGDLVGLARCGGLRRSLADQGVLGRLQQADLRPCICALVKSAPAHSVEARLRDV